MRKIITFVLATMVILSMVIPVYAVTPTLKTPSIKIPQITSVKFEVSESTWEKWFEDHPIYFKLP